MRSHTNLIYVTYKQFFFLYLKKINLCAYKRANYSSNFCVEFNVKLTLKGFFFSSNGQTSFLISSHSWEKTFFYLENMWGIFIAQRKIIRRQWNCSCKMLNKKNWKFHIFWRAAVANKSWTLVKYLEIW